MKLALVGVGVCALGTVLLGLWGSDAPSADVVGLAAPKALPVAPAARPPSRAFPWKIEMAPEAAPSMAQVGSANTLFQTDLAGKLVLDDATAQRLEAFAVSLPVPHRADELERIAREGLSPEQGTQALRMLQKYLVYRDAEVVLLTQGRVNDDVAGVQYMLQRLSALRKHYLGAQTAQSLFASQEALAGKAIDGFLAEN